MCLIMPFTACLTSLIFQQERLLDLWKAYPKVNIVINFPLDFLQYMLRYQSPFPIFPGF